MVPVMAHLLLIYLIYVAVQLLVKMIWVVQVLIV